MRRLIPFLPALVVGLAAFLFFDSWGDRRSVAMVETPLARLSLGPGRHLDFELAFRVLHLPARLDACPTLFVHLLDAEGRIVRNFDHRISLWPGPAETSRIVDRSTLVLSALDEPLTPGTYQLAAGLWEPETELRLRLHREGTGPTRRLPVAEVEVMPAAAREPKLTFSDAWSAPEPVDTVHGRSRRSWTRPATIEIDEQPAPLEWRLVLDLPPWVTPRGELEVGCTGETVQLLERWQEIRFQVPAGAPCSLHFPPIDSTGETGALLYALSRSETSAETPAPACIRAL